MRTHVFFFYFLLDIAYPEFSETDGELDDYDENNGVVEGDKKNNLARKQTYLEFNYLVLQFLFFPLF